MSDRPADPAASHALAAARHDLGNALNLVIGLAANLRDGLDGPLTPEQRASMARIVDVALHAGAVLERLGDDLAPHDAGPLSPRTERVHLTALVGRVLSFFAPTARHRDVALAPPAPAPLHVDGDALALSRAIYNLVDNALKFTPPGGRVAVRVRRLDDAPLVEIEVADSGPGVPPVERGRVLERGARLGRDAAVPGRGVGLSIVREVAARHGGDLTVGVAAEGGASMRFRLPAVDDDGEAPAPLRQGQAT